MEEVLECIRKINSFVDYKDKLCVDYLYLRSAIENGKYIETFWCGPRTPMVLHIYIDKSLLTLTDEELRDTIDTAVKEGSLNKILMQRIGYAP